MLKQKYEYVIRARVTFEEKNKIEKRVKETGHSNLSDFIRKSCIDGYHEDKTLRSIAWKIFRSTYDLSRLLRIDAEEKYGPEIGRKILELVTEIRDMIREIDQKYIPKKRRFRRLEQIEAKEEKERREIEAQEAAYKEAGSIPLSFLEDCKILNEYITSCVEENSKFEESEELENILVDMQELANDSAGSPTLLKFIVPRKMEVVDTIAAVNILVEQMKDQYFNSLACELRDELIMVVRSIDSGVADRPEVLW